MISPYIPDIRGNDITIFYSWTKNVDDIVGLDEGQTGGVEGEHLDDVVLLEHRVLRDEVDGSSQALVPDQHLGTSYPDIIITLQFVLIKFTVIYLDINKLTKRQKKVDIM